jgi:hypothetical protein
MPTAGFEPAIPASQRPQTHALDCTAIGIGEISIKDPNYVLLKTISKNFENVSS